MPHYKRIEQLVLESKELEEDLTSFGFEKYSDSGIYCSFVYEDNYFIFRKNNDNSLSHIGTYFPNRRVIDYVKS